jgi:hypothetical protein
MRVVPYRYLGNTSAGCTAPCIIKCRIVKQCKHVSWRSRRALVALSGRSLRLTKQHRMSPTLRITECKCLLYGVLRKTLKQSNRENSRVNSPRFLQNSVLRDSDKPISPASETSLRFDHKVNFLLPRRPIVPVRTDGEVRRLANSALIGSRIAKSHPAPSLMNEETFAYKLSAFADMLMIA